MRLKKIFPGVYGVGRDIATENSTPGFRVYDERLLRLKGNEYRLWDPRRSKLAAGILNGLKRFPFNPNSSILYLGASSGTTASHLADICPNGWIYCVEFSKRMMQDLLQVTMKKRNMVPVLADANLPAKYLHQIARIDIIYQDVAQPNQAEILLKNSELFSPRFAMLSIKSRSINAIESPKKVFKREIEKLKDYFSVLEKIDLRPYDRDHVLVNLERK